MLEKISIIIPFQTDHGPRAKAFEWIKKYYTSVMPEAELCIGTVDGMEINKSKAVNSAAKRATRDIFVIADADVIYDPEIIVKAVRLLKEAAWVVPFTEIFNIEKSGTKRLFQESPKWPIDVKPEECKKANWIYEGFAGKLLVIPKENFEAVGGFDERFIGWGGEDDAFSHAVRTICGKNVKIEGEVYHLWHPSSSYQTNPHGKENAELLYRYHSASGNKEEMMKLIRKRNSELGRPQKQNNIAENGWIHSPESKICFAILVHENRKLVKQLIDNVRFYCPNSAIVLYNGGDDPKLCDGLGVPVCPSSRKLNHGWTTIYFLETMEWLEELGVQYEYFINIDSDALFYRKGYEEFIQTEMKDTDYMAVLLRIPELDWFIGKELQKDNNRWKELFNLNPFYGVFNVGQVISRPLVKSLLQPDRKKKLKKVLLETVSFGSDEILFVNMANELGFRIKKYPNPMDARMIRYRPYITVNEMLSCLNSTQSGFLCHPVIREKNNSVRKLILNIQGDNKTKQYKSKEYPWYEEKSNNYSISLPIKSKFGNLELVVRSNSSLTHYWRHPSRKWYKSETFAQDVIGNPVFFENNSGQFVVVCKLKGGGVGLWKRNNQAQGLPWTGPSVILHENADPIMGKQQKDGSYIIVFKYNNKFFYFVIGKGESYIEYP